MTLKYAPLDNKSSAFLTGVQKYYKFKNNESDKAKTNWKGDIIESFLPGMGSKSKSNTTLTDEQKSHIENVNKKINENFMSSMTSIVQKNCVDVANENKQSMMNEIKAANVLSVSGATGKSFNMSGVTQENTVEVTATMSAENKATTKIKTSVSSKTSNQLSDIMKDSKKMGESLSGVLNNAVETVGDSVDNVVNTVGDSVDNTVNAVGGSVNNAVDAVTGSDKSTNATTNILKDDTVINKSLEKATTEINMEEAIENSMENKVTTESLQECGNKIAGENEIILENLDFEEEIEITDIAQKNMITAVIDCQFSNEVCNEIVTDFLNELTKQVEKSTMTEEEQEGFGQALAAAAEGVGQGLATTAEGVGEGTSTAAKGVGEGSATFLGGIGDMFGSMTWILIACCVLLVVGILGFVYMGGIEKATGAVQELKK